MKVIYLDCSSGISSNALMGALYELCTDEQKKTFLTAISLAFPESITITTSFVSYYNSLATQMIVTFCRKIEDFDSLSLPSNVKEQIVSICSLLLNATSKTPKSSLEASFTEQSINTIISIAGCCLLFSILNPDKIYSSAVSLYFGTYLLADKIVSAPSFETLNLLTNVPISNTSLKGELCTSDGAALLTHFVSKYGDIPSSCLKACGYGVDRRYAEQTNYSRALLLDETKKMECNLLETNDSIIEIRCNLDDMTPEAISYASSLLFKEGALDVYTTPINMKKGRSAIMLTCLCKESSSSKLSQLMLLHTTTLGVRFYNCKRMVLTSKKIPVKTPHGIIHFKVSSGFDLQKVKPEYDDLCFCAEQSKLPLTVLQEEAYRCFYEQINESVL